MGSMAAVRFPSGARLLLLHSIQIGSDAHPASYPMGTEGFSPGVKQPGREANNSPPSSTEVKNGGAIPPLPICHHGVMLNKLSTGTNVLYLLYKHTCTYTKYFITFAGFLLLHLKL
jgi:hypothetical protein